MAERGLAGRRVDSAERSSALSEPNRVCAESGCTTRLSVYNEFEYCSLHQPMVVPRMRGKVLD